MKRPVNKGARCQKWQRVSGPGGRRVLRCEQFKYPKRRLPMGYRRGHRPANRGRACRKFQLVKSPWYNKKVWRCSSYGGKSVRRSPPPSRRLPAPRRVRGDREPGFFQRLFGPSEGRVPLSLPSMERQRAGRT